MTEPSSILENLLPGDIFATRNADELDNETPGYWNHLAVCVGENLIVEGQSRRGVIYTGLQEFLDRYPEIRVLRLREGDGFAIADEACRHVGTPFWKLASLPRFLRRTERGNNCVSLVRRSVAVPRALGRDPGWRTPDDAVADPSFEVWVGK